MIYYVPECVFFNLQGNGYVPERRLIDLERNCREMAVCQEVLYKNREKKPSCEQGAFRMMLVKKVSKKSRPAPALLSPRSKIFGREHSVLFRTSCFVLISLAHHMKMQKSPPASRGFSVFSHDAWLKKCLRNPARLRSALAGLKVFGLSHFVLRPHTFGAP